jgi:two-component system NtrC family sensor kinase
VTSDGSRGDLHPGRGLQPVSHDRKSITDADFVLIAESIPHIVWMAAPDGITEYFNRRGSDYTGLPPEANYGWDWLRLVHPDDAERAQRSWEHAIRSQTVYELEYRIRRFDGQYRWHSFRGLPVRHTDGHVIKWIGTCTDIEDRKRLEENLRLLEQQTAQTLTLLERLQDTAPVGLGFVDKEFRIMRVNEAFASVSGASVQNHLGRRLDEMMPPLWAQLEPICRSVLATGEPLVNQPIIGDSAADQSRVHHWLISAYTVRGETEVTGVGLVLVDVTERRVTEHGKRHGLPASTPPPMLGGAKLEILHLASEGYSNREIAAKVHLAENTVKSHLQLIFRQLGVRSRTEAVMRAAREGWI